jgi:hypothetical protein
VRAVCQSLLCLSGLTFSNPPVGLRIDPSSLSWDPVNLTSFQMAAITSDLVPSFIPTRPERGSKTLNLCGKWSMWRTTRHSTFLSPLLRISNPSKWFVRFWGCHCLSIPVYTSDKRGDIPRRYSLLDMLVLPYPRNRQLRI